MASAESCFFCPTDAERECGLGELSSNESGEGEGGNKGGGRGGIGRLAKDGSLLVYVFGSNHVREEPCVLALERSSLEPRDLSPPPSESFEIIFCKRFDPLDFTESPAR